MKTIVVPTDFSAVALNASHYAAELAVSIDASLSIVHVCALPLQYVEMPVPAVHLDELMKDAEVKMAQFKNEISLKTGGQLKIYTEIKAGSVVNQLKLFCSEAKPYAVVMGPRSAGGLERFLFGSNTITAIKNLAWPLIVVPAKAKFRAIHNIGLACNFKQLEDKAPVEVIRKLVRDLHANLHILYINKYKTWEYGADFIEEAGWLQEMIGDLDPKYHFVKHSDIDEGLNENATTYALDLLIVIPKKHGWTDALFHHSHTKQLTLHSRIPMMAVHE